MREKIKGILIGIAIGALMTGGAGFAKTAIEEIQVHYNDIKVYKDGVRCEMKDVNGVEAEPFIYNGTTYLPVRAVANAAGLGVEWDDNTKSVLLFGKADAKTEDDEIARTIDGFMNSFKSLELKEAQKYLVNGSDAWEEIEETASFIDGEITGNISSAFGDMVLTEEEKGLATEKIENIYKSVLSVMMYEVTGSNVSVDTADAKIKITMIDYAKLEEVNIDTDSLLIRYLEKNEISAQELSEYNEEQKRELAVDFTICMLDYMADYLGESDVLPLVVHEYDILFERVDGKWLITSMK